MFTEQEPGGAIAHATRTDAGWVFLLEDGRVTVSDGFLGADVDARSAVGETQGLPSIGRAAYLVSGRLWTCDGRTVALAEHPRAAGAWGDVPRRDDGRGGAQRRRAGPHHRRCAFGAG